MTQGLFNGHVCRLVAGFSLLTAALLPIVGVSPVGMVPSAAAAVTTAPRATAAAGSPVTMSLTSIAPTVSRPSTATTLSGTVRNSGSVRIDVPVALALIGYRGLTSREAVSGWASSVADQPVAEAARISLGATLAPGAVRPFTLVIPARAISHAESFAALPLSVTVVGRTAESAGQVVTVGGLRTFLPALAAIKAYEPLSIAWLVPLTLDPDPALHGMDSTARAAAWTKAIGPGSRVDRLIRGTERAPVTWAIDPAVLGPPVAPDASGPSATARPTASSTPSATPTDGGTAPDDPVTEATTALAGRLRAAASRHTVWSLPYADPDLDALLPLSSGRRALGTLIAHSSVLGSAVGATRSDIAWPADGTLTSQREQQLKQVFASPGLAGAVTSASTRSIGTGYTDNASRRSSTGLPLLAYDQSLSRTFAETSAATGGAVTIQRFLADSMALLGERPGTPDRTVLVAAPRAFAGDPSVLGALFAAVAKAPWLRMTTTDQLLAASRAAAPEVSRAKGTATTAPPTPSPAASANAAAADPLLPGPSLLTAGRLQTISARTSAIDGIASIRDDAQPFRVRWTDAQQQLLSVRWRGHPGLVTAVDSATLAAIASVSRGVRVAPSSVNFFADRGVLQVTVLNDLPVPVHDIRLILTPGQPRLRIEQQPGPLRIGAKSRTNVKLNVTAIAAGLVPIEAVLTTSNGTPLGQNARVDVRVQPTSTWIYWVLGGVAGVILVLGVYRSLRRGSTRGSRPAAQEIPVDE